MAREAIFCKEIRHQVEVSDLTTCSLGMSSKVGAEPIAVRGVTSDREEVFLRRPAGADVAMESASRCLTREYWRVLT